MDNKEQAIFLLKSKLAKYFEKEGIEGTIEAIERLNNRGTHAIYNLYVECIKLYFPKLKQCLKECHE